MDNESQFNILIADDNASGLYSLIQILKVNYNVNTVRYGRAAIKRVLEEKPNLILLDVILPDMSGFEVLSEIKKCENTREIPVIIITSLSDSANERIGLKLGAMDYITKPFNPEVVKARIEAQFKIVKQIREIECLGMIDALTGLPNWRSFEEQINVEWGRAVREKTPLSLLMMDVDRFNVYNDLYGHQQGDVILKEFAVIFNKSLKRATDLAFRWSGEEFAALLPNTDLGGALTLAENIRLNVENMKIPFNGLDTSITVSIGVSEALPGKEEVSDFIHKADKALNTAKLAGRNQVCC